MQGLRYVCCTSYSFVRTCNVGIFTLGLGPQTIYVLQKMHEVLRRCWNILLGPNLLDANRRLKGPPARATHPLHTAT